MEMRPLRQKVRDWIRDTHQSDSNEIDANDVHGEKDHPHINSIDAGR
jgi:hypothetical protein